MQFNILQTENTKNVYICKDPYQINGTFSTFRSWLLSILMLTNSSKYVWDLCAFLKSVTSLHRGMAKKVIVTIKDNSAHFNCSPAKVLIWLKNISVIRYMWHSIPTGRHAIHVWRYHTRHCYQPSRYSFANDNWSFNWMPSGMQKKLARISLRYLNIITDEIT